MQRSHGIMRASWQCDPGEQLSALGQACGDSAYVLGCNSACQCCNSACLLFCGWSHA